MDAPCKIQGSIHVFRLVNNMCPGKWVHIINGLFLVPNIYTFSNISRNSSLYFLQFLWIIKLYLIYAPQVGKGDLVCVSN